MPNKKDTKNIEKTNDKKDALVPVSEPNKKPEEKAKKKFPFKGLSYFLLATNILTIGTVGYLLAESGNNDTKMSAKEFVIDENKTELSNKVVSLEQQVKDYKQKEEELLEREEKYNLNMEKFEDAKKEQERKDKLALIKDQDSDKESENYQKMIGELLNDNDSSLYSAVSKVSNSLNSLGDDVDNMKSKSWKKKMLSNTEELNKQIKTITQFPIQDVPSKHKASYNELINAIDLYKKATKSIEDGINKKNINDVVSGSSDMSEGAKYFQMALNIYATETSNK